MSLPSVSRILSGKGDAHNSETRKRVRDTASRMGYRVNTSARAVRSGQFDTVALLLGQVGLYSQMSSGMLSGVHDALLSRNQRLLVTCLPDDSLTDPGFMPRILGESAADGLLMIYNAKIPPRLEELLLDNKVPAIWVNSRHDKDCIYPDDFQARREAVKQLHAMGHRRIAYADYLRAPHYSSPDRCAGHEAGMRDLGLMPLTRRPEQLSKSEVLDHITSWLTAPHAERPTAVISYNPSQLTYVQCVALRLGLRVPEDLSLVTISDSIDLDIHGKDISTMLLPEYRIGGEAVEMLMGKIEDPSVDHAPRVVPLVFEARGTTKVLS